MRAAQLDTPASLRRASSPPVHSSRRGPHRTRPRTDQRGARRQKKRHHHQLRPCQLRTGGTHDADTIHVDGNLQSTMKITNEHSPWTTQRAHSIPGNSSFPVENRRFDRTCNSVLVLLRAHACQVQSSSRIQEESSRSILTYAKVTFRLNLLRGKTCFWVPYSLAVASYSEIYLAPNWLPA